MKKINMNIGELLMLVSVIILSIYTYTVRQKSNEIVKLYNQKVSHIELTKKAGRIFKSFSSKVDTLFIELEKHKLECPHYKINSND